MKAVAASSAFDAPTTDAWVGEHEGESVPDAFGDEADVRPAESGVLVSFDAIYDQHFVFVWRTLRALGVAAAHLDDATQDVFVVVHRRLDTFEGRSKVTTWLFGIARRVARNYRRGLRTAGDLSEVLEAASDGRPSPYEETVRSEAILLLERVLDALEEKKRIVFVLMEIEQMTAEEVAAILGINANTVYSRRRFARLEFDRLVALYSKNK